jgi:hypothetical protein
MPDKKAWVKDWTAKRMAEQHPTLMKNTDEYDDARDEVVVAASLAYDEHCAQLRRGTSGSSRLSSAGSAKETARKAADAKKPLSDILKIGAQYKEALWKNTMKSTWQWRSRWGKQEHVSIEQ